MPSRIAHANIVVYLCEVSDSKSLGALGTRLKEWNSHWSQVKAALVRDSGVHPEWHVRPWLFIPTASLKKAVNGIHRLGPGETRPMPDPRITPLESVVPWKYGPWPGPQKPGPQKKMQSPLKFHTR